MICSRQSFGSVKLGLTRNTYWLEKTGECVGVYLSLWSVLNRWLHLRNPAGNRHTNSQVTAFWFSANSVTRRSSNLLTFPVSTSTWIFPSPPPSEAWHPDTGWTCFVENGPFSSLSPNNCWLKAHSIAISHNCIVHATWLSSQSYFVVLEEKSTKKGFFLFFFFEKENWKLF